MQKNKPIFTCMVCNKVVELKRSFCSIECHNKFYDYQDGGAQ